MKIHSSLLHRSPGRSVRRINPGQIASEKANPPSSPQSETLEEEIEEKEEKKTEPEVLHLLTLNATLLGVELSTGKYDSSLKVLLDAEEEGKNRKGHKAKLEERILSLAG